MIHLPEALQLIRNRVEPLGQAEVPIAEAWGCRLARDVVAAQDLPAYAQATTSGIAISIDDLKGAGEWTIPVVSTVPSEEPKGKPRPRRAVRVEAGAHLPPGADAVIPDVQARVEGHCLILRERPERWQNCRPAGGDVPRGTVLFQAGTELKTTAVGGLAALGLSTVPVVPKPRVAVVTAVPQRVEPGGSYAQEGYVTEPLLLALLDADGRRAAFIQNVPKVKESFTEVLGRVVPDYDLVIAGGGVSQADDHVPRAVAQMGGEVLFHGVAVEPGGTSLLALIPKARADSPSSRAVLLGLPGSITGSLAAYFLFVRHVTARLMGKEYRPMRSSAVISADVRLASDRLQVVGVRLTPAERGRAVEPVVLGGSNGSAVWTGLDGIVLAHPGHGYLKAGATVTVEWV